MFLGLFFFIVAIFYSSVGFGGGSSYLALLVLWDVPFIIVPIIALICNIVVVSGNSFHYVRAGYLNWRLFLPPTLTAIPMAYIGGRLAIEKDVFIIILFVTLLIAGLRLLINYKKYDADEKNYEPISLWLNIIVGGVLGFLAGVVGIGGGIFLAPILYNLRAGSPKNIATTASLFILLNSVAGLFGQLHKNDFKFPDEIIDYWYLPLLVFIGGQIGNFITLKIVPQKVIALLTALLVLFVAGRLGVFIWRN